MRRGLARIAAAVVAVGAGWAFYAWGGAATAALGLGATDPLARLALAFLALTALEAAFSRLGLRHEPIHEPHGERP